MKNVIKILMIIVLINSFMTIKGQMEWIDFGNQNEGGSLPDYNLNSDSLLSIDFFGVYHYRVIENDTTYDVLKLPGNCSQTDNIGFPLIPTKVINIELSVDTPSVVINSEEYIIINDYNLMPLQNEIEYLQGDLPHQFEKK